PVRDAGAGGDRRRDAAVVRASLDGILATLRQSVGAARVTLRLDDDRRRLSVADVAAEAVASGVASLRGQTSIDQRAARTIQSLEAHPRGLGQGDPRGAHPGPRAR